MNMLESPFLADAIRISREIYAKGWGEASGGNLSIRIPAEEMCPFAQFLRPAKKYKLRTPLPELAGDYFLVSASGAFFRYMEEFPHENLGIIRIRQKGESYQVVWGYTTGARPTSELPAHLISQTVRKKISKGRDRVLLHVHATNLIALSAVLPLETAVITRKLWEMMSECLMFFPDGIGVLDWMVPGQEKIGSETARLMKKHRLILWAHHGICGAGENLDQVFGLIETADKAADMRLKAMAAGGIKQAISTGQLKALAKAVKVQPLKAALEL
ncbi:MAG: rhamnulose-1-phosphate aldolase [Thermodesulfobacteriota bacterium]